MLSVGCDPVARAKTIGVQDLFEQKLLPKYPPVFYDWFMAQFPDPADWYRARQRYTQTAAVMSMVGYVIGLGDRHCENIMFDHTTGDTVHVDFNCLFNKGENCIAAGRIFIQESIHDDLLEKLVAATKQMIVGDPLDVSTAHGPQNHKKHLESLVAFAARGKAEGARLVLGGERLDREGLFFPPTIFTDVTDDMWIAEEESFGPIMIILKFKSEKEVVVRIQQRRIRLFPSSVSTSRPASLLAACCMAAMWHTRRGALVRHPR